MLSLSLVAGRIVDERGLPLRGALVGAAHGGDSAVGRTDTKGRFAIGIASAGLLRVLARKAGFGFGIRREVPPWTLDLELVLGRVGAVEGRVVADPMPRRWRLALWRWEPQGRVRPMMCSVLRRPGGLFSAARLRPGVYELQAEAEGYETERVVVDVGEGEVVDGLEIRLARGE